MYGFWDIAIFRCWQFGLKMRSHAPFGWVFRAQFPQIMSLIILSPKGPYFGGTTSFEPYSVNIGRAVWAGHWRKKKRTGLDRKNVTKGLYFTYLGRSPHSSDHELADKISRKSARNYWKIGLTVKCTKTLKAVIYRGISRKLLISRKAVYFTVIVATT